MIKIERYKWLLIIVTVNIISITGMALVNIPKNGIEYWKSLEMSASIEHVIESTLNLGFERSLVKMDSGNIRMPFEMQLESSYQIDNNLVDYGIFLHGNVNQEIEDDKVFRKMISILSDKYIRVRRNDFHEKRNDELRSVEEHGLVYDLSNRYAYINKLIISNNEVWVLMLTFDENAVDKVKDLLDRIWIQEGKGTRIG